MNKVRKLFRAMSLILKQPALLNKVLDDGDVNRNEVIRSYGLKDGLPLVDITELLPGFDETVEPFSSMDGGSTPFDLGLLCGLAKKKAACSYFEIGTWRGESVANVARYAANCSTLNLPDETMLAMGMDKRYVALHRFFSKDLPNVKHLYGNSLHFDFGPHEKKYDLVFVDGDHHYESVKADTANAFRLLKDESGVIVWHDYGNNPADIRWDVLRGILDGTPAGLRKNLYRVSNTLCAIYTSAQVAASLQQKYPDPKHFFRVRVKVAE